MLENIAKDRKVIPDPIDDRKFQEWKSKGEKVNRILSFIRFLRYRNSSHPELIFVICSSRTFLPRAISHLIINFLIKETDVGLSRSAFLGSVSPFLSSSWGRRIIISQSIINNLQLWAFVHEFGSSN